MPMYLHLDPSDPASSFCYTPDSEIVTLYENGVPMERIVKTVKWQDKVKITSARQRVSAAIMAYHLGKVRPDPKPPATSDRYTELPRSAWHPYRRSLTPIFARGSNGLLYSKCSLCGKCFNCTWNEPACRADPAAPPPYPLDGVEPFPDANLD